MTTPIVVPTEAETAESARRVLTGVTVLLGVLTLGLGIAVLAWPDATLFVVAVVIAIQLFGFGIVQIIVRSRRDGFGWNSHARRDLRRVGSAPRILGSP